MILADKITDLRKKNGWSQEELAGMLDVSRQSISKWESAQSTPDMNRILKMSEVFGAFLAFRDLSSGRISIGVMMCILSPVLLIVLSALQEEGLLAISEMAATGIGLVVLITLIGGAVALFVTTGLLGARFEYLEKEDIPENYTEFDSRLDELCQEDIELLNELLEPLRQIKRPEREQLVRLSRLRADKYKDLLYTYEYAMINQAFSALSGD